MWFAEDAGTDIADRLSSQPESGIQTFERRHSIAQGTSRPVRDGFERFLRFYVPLPAGVDLLRIAHGGRNLERLLKEGFLPGPPSFIPISVISSAAEHPPRHQ